MFECHNRKKKKTKSRHTDRVERGLEVVWWRLRLANGAVLCTGGRQATVQLTLMKQQNTTSVCVCVRRQYGTLMWYDLVWLAGTLLQALTVCVCVCFCVRPRGRTFSVLCHVTFSDHASLGVTLLCVYVRVCARAAVCLSVGPAMPRVRRHDCVHATFAVRAAVRVTAAGIGRESW